MSYIEKEPIIEFITKGLNNPDKSKAFGFDAIEILTEIEYAPTADVVLKSEVMKVVGEYYDKCDECRVKISTSVAMEILEQIESVMFNRFSNIMLGEDIKLCIAELKKKYTEV